MQNYLRLFVSITLWSQISTGRTYRARYGRPHDTHSQFHHGFEHHDVGNWHNGAPNWDPLHHTLHIKNTLNRRPIIHTKIHDESKEYWRQHHSATMKDTPHQSAITKNVPWIYNIHGPGNIYMPTTIRIRTLPPITPTGFAFIHNCMQTCPSTPEYDPVCGTNNVTYSNPSRLMCAKQCGIKVNLRHKSRCPTIFDFKVETTTVKTCQPQTQLTKPTSTSADLPDSDDEYWTDILQKDPPFFYTDHTQSTNNPMNETYENTTGKPRNKNINWSKVSFTKRPKYNNKVLHSPREIIDVDENFDIDIRMQPFDM